jgi:hypothetical protein
MQGDADVKIAVLEEQLKGIREQQKAHAEASEKQFTKLFTKIEELEAALNRGKGVFAASLTFAGIIGAGITALVEWVLTGHK